LTIEGDIVITPEQKAALEAAIKSDTVADLEAWRTRGEKWRREIPYVISTAVSHPARRAIDEALQWYHNNTCIKFIPRTTATHYLNFVDYGYG